MATDLSTVYALLGTAIGISVAALVLTALLGMIMWRRYKQSTLWDVAPTKSERPLLPLNEPNPVPNPAPISTSSPSDWLAAFPPQQEQPLVPAAILSQTPTPPPTPTAAEPAESKTLGAMFFYDNF